MLVDATAGIVTHSSLFIANMWQAQLQTVFQNVAPPLALRPAAAANQQYATAADIQQWVADNNPQLILIEANLGIPAGGPLPPAFFEAYPDIRFCLYATELPNLDNAGYPPNVIGSFTKDQLRTAATYADIEERFSASTINNEVPAATVPVTDTKGGRTDPNDGGGGDHVNDDDPGEGP